MGKDNRRKTSVRTTPYSLDKQIVDGETPKQHTRSKAASLQLKSADEDESVPEALKQKVMSVARSQQEDEKEAEHEETVAASIRQEPRIPGIEDDEDDGMEDVDDNDGCENISDEEREEDYNGNVAIDQEDESALDMFMAPSGSPATSSLSVLVSKQLKEQEAKLAASQQRPHIDHRVVQVYKGLLATYKSGRLPKAFKLLPALSNWEELVFITRPDEWTPNAMRVAVKLFASGLNTKLVQRFYNLVLLPCIREAIHRDRKLSFHHYLSLKKALYKPAAFYKGFLLPLCESGDCTLREGVIISSVLAKVSVPMLHSAAAILKLAQMRYSGATSIFLRTLIDKKYSLPFRVVDAVVDHFLRFMSDQRRMVVLWFQCLLVFVQRYKNDLTSDQKTKLKSLLQVHTHPFITPDIRNELDNSGCRGDNIDPVLARAFDVQFLTTSGSSTTPALRAPIPMPR